MTPNYNYQQSAIGAADAANLALQGFSYHSVPGLNPVTLPSIYGAQFVPQAENPETVAANNPSNATSSGVSAASSNFSAGAAQAAGYSTGSPR